MTVAFDDRAREKMREQWHALDLAYDGTPISDMVVKRIECKIARMYIASFHYSHTMPDSTRFAYAGYLNGKLCGVVCYGMGCGKNQYTALIPNIGKGEYVELTRLWCANDYPKNTESKLISASLRMLPPEIKLIVSFADESLGHCGTIYQATNWYYCGVNGGGTQLISENGLKKHSRLLGIYKMRHPEYEDMSAEELREKLGYKVVKAGRKFRYVYLRGTKGERKKMLRQIQDKIEPYPKMPPKNDKQDDSLMLGIVKPKYEQITFEEYVG